MLRLPTQLRNHEPARRAPIRDRLLAGFVVAMVGAALAPAAALADGRIAFNSQGEDRWERILRVDADGAGLTEITGTAGAHRISPSWSREGDRLAFIGDVDVDGDGQSDSREIFIVDADGTGLTRVTHNDIVESHPDWSPDGTRIAYMHGGDIWAVNVDGTGADRITSGDEFDNQPTWSPDGAQIAFDRSTESQYAIHVVNADGSGLSGMTNTEAVNDEAPAWSPDGTRLAVTSYPNTDSDDDDEEVVLIDVDTRERTALTANDTDDYAPTWSPDSREIAYVGRTRCGDDPECDSNSEIFALNADGTGVRRNLSKTVAVSDSRPDWGRSPAPADRDGDGIPDGLDENADAPSTSFSDGAGTTGSIVDAGGLPVTLSDLPAPDGVRVTVGAGGGQATLRACGYTVRLAAGSVAELTCGSVRVKVVEGEARIVTGDGLSLVTVAAGAEAKVSEVAGGSRVESFGGAVTVVVDWVARPVTEGAAATVTPSAARLCRATVDAVRGSARYQALSGPARALVDRTVGALCDRLDAVVAGLRPERKAAVVAAYKRGLDAVVAGGWLTADQAAVLRAAADAL